MSIYLTTQVWRFSPQAGGYLLVLLCLADHAGDDARCWPSVALMAGRSRLSERQVGRALHRLERDGELEIPPGPRHHGNPYRLVGEYLSLGGGSDAQGSEVAARSDIEGAGSDIPGSADRTFTSDPYVEASVRTVREPSKADEVGIVWDHYVAVFGASRQNLDSTRKTIIKNALKVRNVEECKRAIEGLRVDPFYNGENDRRQTYLGIQYALKGRNGTANDEQIDRMAALAPDSPTSAPGVSQDKIERRVAHIRDWHRSGGTLQPGLAAQYMAELDSWGLVVELLDDAPFVRLRPKDL